MRMPPANTVPRERTLDAADAAAGDRGAGAARPRALRHPLRGVPRLRRRRRQRGRLQDVAARAADARRRQGARLPGARRSSTSPPTATATCRSTTRRSSVQDRWAIANYVKALQLSQHASLDDVPADKRGDLDKPADGRREEVAALGEQGMSAPKEIVLPRAPWEGGGRNMIVAGARRRHRPRAVVRVDELRHARARRRSRGCGPSSTG